jgi:hypothetical protein
VKIDACIAATKEMPSAPRDLRHTIVQDADKDQHADFDEEAHLRGPFADNATQPRGDHHADEEGKQRRHEVKCLLPSPSRGIYPQKHQIGRLRIRQNAVCDPGVGVEIAANEAQQQGDQQGLLAAYRRIDGSHGGCACVHWTTKRRPPGAPG